MICGGLQRTSALCYSALKKRRSQQAESPPLLLYENFKNANGKSAGYRVVIVSASLFGFLFHRVPMPRRRSIIAEQHLQTGDKCKKVNQSSEGHSLRLHVDALFFMCLPLLRRWLLLLSGVTWRRGERAVSCGFSGTIWHRLRGAAGFLCQWALPGPRKKIKQKK